MRRRSCAWEELLWEKLCGKRFLWDELCGRTGLSCLWTRSTCSRMGLSCLQTGSSLWCLIELVVNEIKLLAKDIEFLAKMRIETMQVGARRLCGKGFGLHF